MQGSGVRNQLYVDLYRLMSPDAEILDHALSLPGDASSVESSAVIIGYFLILFLALGLGAPSGIAAIPISYILKDHLHLSPVDFALFVAIASGPTYIAFLLGFLRDQFRPRVMGDRAYQLIGAMIALRRICTWRSRQLTTSRFSTSV